MRSLAWASPGHCIHLGNGPVDSRYISTLQISKFLFLIKERDLPFSGLLPKCLQQLGTQELGARNSVPISHGGGRDPVSSAISCHLPGYVLAEGWNRNGTGTWT